MSRGWRSFVRGAFAAGIVGALAAGSALGAAEGPVAVELLPLTPPDLEHLEEAVAVQLRETQELLVSSLEQPGTDPHALGDAFGTAGKLYHAYELDEAAATCYANAKRLAPRDFRWAYLAGVLDQEAGRLDQAAEGFTRALELDSGSIPAMVRLGNTQLALQNLDQARHWLERALELDASIAAARASLGQIALSEKRYQDAVDHLRSALELIPGATRLHHPLGLAYRGLGDLDQARHHLGLRGSVGVRPPDPLIDELTELKVGERVFLLRGRVAFRAGRYAEAVEAFQAALAAEPESIRARVNLASALAQAGDKPGAVKLFEEVLERDPDNAATRFNLGVLLVEMGEYQRAAESYEAAVALRPEDAVAQLELARVRARLGAWSEALGSAKRATALDPANEGARLVAAQALNQLGRFPETLHALEEAAELLPGAGTIAATLSRFLATSPDLELRDGQRAVALASRVFEATRDPRHAEILALAFAEVGRCGDAENWQRQAFEAAQEAGAEALAQALGATLRQLEQRPCRWPGQAE
ncbi:MAG: tetratricopeptide repeat protein [Acidobacteriota bacterium]